MCLMATPSTRSCHQQAGAKQGGLGCIAQGEDWAESPEGSVREVTRDRNPNCGIARERENKESERELSREKALT